ncbi:MAG: endonuclease/exonuclease/phosphatase family protein [Clostridia bacterium]|nr:endonuclease/exonuclease/phosphatase family protein [Clostridia bacterium]
MNNTGIIKDSVVSFFLAAAVIIGCLPMAVYYPRYLSEKKEYSVEKVYEAEADEIRVMSCNVRCVNPLDTGKKSWFYRANYVLEGIENTAPGIIGFQEVTRWQYSYICDCLPDYDSVITYRDTAYNSESCPVFYNTKLYSLIEDGSFWLSETPDVMSKDWDSGCYRICSYIILETKENSNRFVVFNFHLDNESEEARINGIKLILRKIEEFGSLPAVLMGDFNAGEGSTTYNCATEIFNDAAVIAPETMRDSCTYQNWGKALERGRIDYFMISKQGLTALEYKVITDTYDGAYSSDHFPIFALLKFEN